MCVCWGGGSGRSVYFLRLTLPVNDWPLTLELSLQPIECVSSTFNAGCLSGSDEPFHRAPASVLLYPVCLPFSPTQTHTHTHMRIRLQKHVKKKTTTHRMHFSTPLSMQPLLARVQQWCWCHQLKQLWIHKGGGSHLQSARKNKRKTSEVS